MNYVLRSVCFSICIKTYSLLSCLSIFSRRPTTYFLCVVRSHSIALQHKVTTKLSITICFTRSAKQSSIRRVFAFGDIHLVRTYNLGDCFTSFPLSTLFWYIHSLSCTIQKRIQAYPSPIHFVC